jgi:hypothetical protein
MIRDLNLRADPVPFEGFCDLLMRLKKEELRRKEKSDLHQKKGADAREGCEKQRHNRQ